MSKSEEESDSKDKSKIKKKKKSKVESDDNEDESEDKSHKKKSKSKSKVDKTESEDEEEKPKKKKKSKSKFEKTESEDEEKSRKKSKIESSDVEKAEISPEIDPMKDKNRMKMLKKCISHLCLLVMVLGVKNVFLGLCAHFFYNDKTHLVIFGGLAIMQLIGAPIGWTAIQMGNRVLFLVCAIINVIWLICVIIMMVWYWFIRNTSSFNNEIALHVGAVFFMSASITLAICCFLMMKRLDMINIQYKKPEVYVSSEGKASQKAKLKHKSK